LIARPEAGAANHSICGAFREIKRGLPLDRQ